MKRYITDCNPDYSSLRPIVESITLNGAPDDAQVIFSKRNTVYTMMAGDEKLNIKAFRLPNIENAFIYTTLRKSKAFRSYQNACRLIEMGFLTPKPIGYGEERDGIKLCHSYYISQHIDALNMRNWQDKPDCEPLLRAFAKEIVRLHHAGVWHKDFSPGNIIYTGNATDGYKFYYIDLNRMRCNIKSRNKLMSMFRAINLNPAETERLARYYAEEAGENPDNVAQEALKQLEGYFSEQRRKKWFKSLFKKAKK